MLQKNASDKVTINLHSDIKVNCLCLVGSRRYVNNISTVIFSHQTPRTNFLALKWEFATFSGNLAAKRQRQS